ncbi:hypothetical protein BU24DRAFT_429496, partial [Aaosphaeria arxii CBS 175.79]
MFPSSADETSLPLLTRQPLTTSTMQHLPSTVQPFTTSTMQHLPPTVQPFTTSAMQHLPSTVQQSMPAWQNSRSNDPASSKGPAPSTVQRPSKHVPIFSPEQYTKMVKMNYDTILLGFYWDSILGGNGLRFRHVCERQYTIEEIITGITCIFKEHNGLPKDLQPLLNLKLFTIEVARSKPPKTLISKDGIARALIALLSTPLQVPGYSGQRSVIGYEDNGSTLTLMLDVTEEHKQHSIFYEEADLSWSQVLRVVEPHLHSIREHWHNQNQIVDNTNNSLDNNTKSLDNTNSLDNNTNSLDN